MANGDDMDWAQLLGPYKDLSVGSSRDAQMLVAAALGPRAIATGVEYYLDNWMSGTEVLRYVFKMLQPAEATDRLLAVLGDEGESTERRQAAADLLAVTCLEPNLPQLEALLGGDAVSQTGVAQVLGQLRWNIDCDTPACASIVKRGMAERTPEALLAALQVAPIACAEMTNPDCSDTDRRGLLSTDDVIELYTVSLSHPEERVLESALSTLHDELATTLMDRIQAVRRTGGDLRQLALEILEH